MTSNQNRLASLDAFRGLTIAAMILVNCPGTYSAVYFQLKHAEWNGWTFADTIFPSFLFIMGVSMVFSFAGRRQDGNNNSKLEFQIVKRTLILFGLGLFINSFPIFHLATIRVPGVLQRIALCYFFTSLILLYGGIRGQVCWLVGLIAGYWLVMRYVPVPGIGAGVLEPGRNLAAYVDSLFLGGHMWTHYETWDPEGMLSTTAAIGTTLFGVLAGHWLRSSFSGSLKAMGMLLAGIGLIALGLLLDNWLPINKSIWTSTFSIFMAGIASVCLALFYWMVDLKGYRRWAIVFVVFGVNPITMYVISEVLDISLRFVRLPLPNGSTLSYRSIIYRTVFVPLAGPEMSSFLFAVASVLLMLALAWIMWKKRLILKV
jgi:predicted acyltransferase